MSLNQIPDFMLSDDAGNVKDKIAVLSGAGGVVEKTNKSEFDKYKADTAIQLDLLDTKASDPLSQIGNHSIPSAKLKILNDADRIGLENLKLEVIQVMAGTTSVNSIPADYSVTPKRTSFFKAGKNLFNKVNATSGYFVDRTNGNLVANASYYASEFIPVIASTQYTNSPDTTQSAFYDSAKVYISGTLATGTVTTPSNCAYMRISVGVANINKGQLELGAVSTAFEPFRYYIPDDQIQNGANSVTPEITNFLHLGKNLFNKADVTTGYYIDYTNGTLVANAFYSVSNYIYVEPSTQYIRSYDHQMVYYDANKVYISGRTSSLLGAFTTPANCRYIRTTVSTSLIDTIQLELGAVSTLYEPYGYKMPILIDVTPKSELLAFLPSEICIAVGRTIELYNKQVVWNGNLDNYHIRWACDIGKAMKRKWSCLGVADKIGNHTLTLNIYDNNMNKVLSASTIVKIVTNVITTPKQILTIGDSLTNEKPWEAEFRTLSANQFELVGTRGNCSIKTRG